MGIANFAVILLLNYRKQEGHYCHDILAMLAEWEEEIPEDVAHLDIRFTTWVAPGTVRNVKWYRHFYTLSISSFYHKNTTNKKIDISFIVHLKQHQLLKVYLKSITMQT